MKVTAIQKAALRWGTAGVVKGDAEPVVKAPRRGAGLRVVA